MRFLLALMLCAATIAASPPKSRPMGPPATPGCDPAQLRMRLERVQSLTISRACGNISRPWAYRGPSGREMSMRSYGRHEADSTYGQRMAGYLIQDATVDTVTEAPSTRVECDPASAKPMYLLEFRSGKQATYAVVWFELGVALFFDADQPLGMVVMGPRADSVWAELGELMPDDPLLRKERPASPQGAALTSMRGDAVIIDQLPEAITKVAPKFPFTAQELGIAGLVIVQAKIGVDGRVHDAFVVEGHRLLRDEALKAVWQWQFDPATWKGEPVAAWVSVPVRFTLKD